MIKFAASSIPIYDNEVLGANNTVFVSSNEEDWQLVPDTDGKLHLVDIKNVDLGIEPSFVAFNDIVFRLSTRTHLAVPITINNNAQLDASSFKYSTQENYITQIIP